MVRRAAVSLSVLLALGAVASCADDGSSGAVPAARDGGTADGGVDLGSGTEDGGAVLSDGEAPGDGGVFMCPVVDADSLRAKTKKVIGAAVDVNTLGAEAIYATTLGKEFNEVTPENVMKWGPIQPTATTFDYGPADTLVAFAEAHCMTVKGHALVWHQQLPDYLAGMNATDLKAAMLAHISAVVGHFKGRIRAWDVVNEAVGDDGNMRSSLFFDTLGESFIADAFTAAHAADPDAELNYNDYSIEQAGTKQDAAVALLKRLLDAGVPVNGVGMQMHATPTYPAISAVPATIARFAKLGLRVNVSEMDFRLKSASGDATLADQRLAYNNVVYACRESKACDGVTFWGFTDKHSWIDEAFGPDDPLPFDEAYAPKPAYFGIAAALGGVAEP